MAYNIENDDVEDDKNIVLLAATEDYQDIENQNVIDEEYLSDSDVLSNEVLDDEI
jgi:hypothetical protein